MEQVPEMRKPISISKSEGHQEEEMNDKAKCAVCRRHWTTYRGKFKCASPQGLCGVPVLVCDKDDCKQLALQNPKQLVCELCIIGHKAPQLMPDLVGLKRKAEAQATKTTDINNDSNNDSSSNNSNHNILCKDRLFLRRLPLTVTKTKLQELLGTVALLHWLADKNSGAFYGSCIVQLESEQDAQQAVMGAAGSSLTLEKKKIQVSYCRKDFDSSWPPANLQDKEYPPIGRYVRVGMLNDDVLYL